MPPWLAALFDAFKVFAIAAGWMKEAHDQQTGVDLQKGRDAEDALVTERKIAEVAAQPVDVDKALGPGGDF